MHARGKWCTNLWPLFLMESLIPFPLANLTASTTSNAERGNISALGRFEEGFPGCEIHLSSFLGREPLPHHSVCPLAPMPPFDLDWTPRSIALSRRSGFGLGFQSLKAQNMIAIHSAEVWPLLGLTTSGSLTCKCQFVRRL